MLTFISKYTLFVNIASQLPIWNLIYFWNILSVNIARNLAIKTAFDLLTFILKYFARAGFNLRKWSSNTEELLCEIPECDREMKSPLSFNEKECLKTLGINWSPRDDMFWYVIQVEYHNVDNKRNMLFDIGKIFNLLGWISPMTIIEKDSS